MRVIDLDRIWFLVGIFSIAMIGFVEAGSVPEVGMSLEIAPKLDITVPARAASGSTKVEATITLENVGLGDLWINGRMLLNTAYAPRSARELWLEVEGPESKKIEFECKVRAGAAKPQDYVLLRPGEKKQVHVNLSDCFNLRDRGTYTIYANYEDGSDSIPQAPRNGVHLRQHLRSHPAVIEIVPEPSLVR